MKRYIFCPTGVVKDAAQLWTWIKQMYYLHLQGDPDALILARHILNKFYPLEE